MYNRQMKKAHKRINQRRVSAQQQLGESPRIHQRQFSNSSFAQKNSTRWSNYSGESATPSQGKNALAEQFIEMDSIAEKDEEVRQFESDKTMERIKELEDEIEVLRTRLG
jgi:hypothetical protein